MLYDPGILEGGEFNKGLALRLAGRDPTSYSETRPVEDDQHDWLFLNRDGNVFLISDVFILFQEREKCYCDCELYLPAVLMIHF